MENVCFNVRQVFKCAHKLVKRNQPNSIENRAFINYNYIHDSQFIRCKRRSLFFFKTLPFSLSPTSWVVQCIYEICVHGMLIAFRSLNISTFDHTHFDGSSSFMRGTKFGRHTFVSHWCVFHLINQLKRMNTEQGQHMPFTCFFFFM